MSTDDSDRSRVKLVLDELRTIVNAHDKVGTLQDTAYQSHTAATFAERVQLHSLLFSFYSLCNDTDLPLAKWIFGDHSPVHDESVQEVKAICDDRVLRLQLTGDVDSTPSMDRDTATDVLVLTNLNRFVFWCSRGSTDEGERFMSLTSSVISDGIQFNGSIWDMVYPSHYGVFINTSSFSFKEEVSSSFFSKSRQSRLKRSYHPLDEEKSAHNRIKCFCTSSESLYSIEEFRQNMPTSERPELLSKKTKGDHILRRYSPRGSDLFNFTSSVSQLKRDDYVSTYNVRGNEFGRDFIINKDDELTSPQTLRTGMFNILYVLAIRRMKLFKVRFARRVYNIVLPPVVMSSTSGTGTSLTMIPAVTLYRIPEVGTFRKTISVSCLFFPIDIDERTDGPSDISTKQMPVDKFHEINQESSHVANFPPSDSQLTNYSVRDLSDGYYEIPSRSTIPSILRNVSRKVLRCTLDTRRSIDEDHSKLIENKVFTTSLDGNMTTLLFLVDWTPEDGYNQPWEKWLQKGNDKNMHYALFRTMFYNDFLQPKSAYASRKVISFDNFDVGNTMGTDMTGMTLYNPSDYTKFVLYSLHEEDYPNYSIIRWMSWQVYIDSALVSMRALISKLHSVLDERKDLHHIIELIYNMIQEFNMFYDLDIRDHFYRDEFENIRRMSDIERDYKQLLSKFSSAKEDSSLREQRLINRLLVAFTLATVSVSISSTFALLRDWSSQTFFLASVVVTLTVVIAGYVLFDPVRSSLSNLYRELKSSEK